MVASGDLAAYCHPLLQQQQQQGHLKARLTGLLLLLLLQRCARERAASWQPSRDWPGTRKQDRVKDSAAQSTSTQATHCRMQTRRGQSRRRRRRTCRPPAAPPAQPLPAAAAARPQG